MPTALTTSTVDALYVHVPFCHTICGYCDFYSVVFDRRSVDPLVDALLAELELVRQECDLRCRTIFVGGGTPTTLPPRPLARLLAALRCCAPAGRVEEFTVEANPATVSDATAALLASHGVTRVSIGAQSFEPGELRVLERIHRPRQVEQTLRICRAAGVPQINLDLIFAVPGQSLEAWLANLRRAIELGPDHLSCYALTYEPGTPLHERLLAGSVRPVAEELEAEMFEATIQTLTTAGFVHYEISNFARPGCECRHNLTYWHNLPYAGIGPSACGYVGGVRYKNVADVSRYVGAIRQGRSPRVEAEMPDPLRQARETAMLELRLREGMHRETFARRFGCDPVDYFRAAVVKHAAGGLLEVTPERIALTRRGLLLADTVIADFLG